MTLAVAPDVLPVITLFERLPKFDVPVSITFITISVSQKPSETLNILSLGNTISASSSNSNLKKYLWPSIVPLEVYKSLIVFISCLFDTPLATVSLIPSKNESLNLVRKSYIVLSTSA